MNKDEALTTDAPTWKERARNARLSNKFIALALGYSNPAKVAQAWSWDKTPVGIRLLIVVAERVSPAELNNIVAEVGP